MTVLAELADAPVQHESSPCRTADDMQLCPMCQTPLPGLGKPYGRVYHRMQSVQKMNETLGTPVQEPFNFKDCSHCAKCDVVRPVCVRVQGP